MGWIYRGDHLWETPATTSCAKPCLVLHRRSAEFPGGQRQGLRETWADTAVWTVAGTAAESLKATQCIEFSICLLNSP